MAYPSLSFQAKPGLNTPVLGFSQANQWTVLVWLDTSESAKLLSLADAAGA
jgi:hypothetical protein